MSWRRSLVALAVVDAAFGVVSAVQASIPDSNGIVHACYNASNANGYPTGALRAIDLDKVNGHCAQGEAPVDLATPQFVTSTINQTSFMVALVGAALTTGQWVATYGCPAGYIATDPAVAGYQNGTLANEAITVHSLYNDGVATTGTPGNVAHLWFVLASDQQVSIHATCVDGRVFGLPGPAAPVKQAQTQATISVHPA